MTCNTCTVFFLDAFEKIKYLTYPQQLLPCLREMTMLEPRLHCNSLVSANDQFSVIRIKTVWCAALPGNICVAVHEFEMPTQSTCEVYQL